MWPHHVEQRFKRIPQVSYGLLWRCAIASRADTRSELGGGGPDAALVLLNDVGYVHVTSHGTSITCVCQYHL